MFCVQGFRGWCSGAGGTVWLREIRALVTTRAARAWEPCGSASREAEVWSWVRERATTARTRWLPCCPAPCTYASANGVWRERRTVLASTGASSSPYSTVSESIFFSFPCRIQSTRSHNDAITSSNAHIPTRSP